MSKRAYVGNANATNQWLHMTWPPPGSLRMSTSKWCFQNRKVWWKWSFHHQMEFSPGSKHFQMEFDCCVGKFVFSECSLHFFWSWLNGHLLGGLALSRLSTLTIECKSACEIRRTLIATVDGRSPAPPEMYKTWKILVDSPNQQVQDFVHQEYVCLFVCLFICLFVVPPFFSSSKCPKSIPLPSRQPEAFFHPWEEDCKVGMVCWTLMVEVSWC